MKKSINRNIFWADVLAAQLKKCGLKHICFSPGSRSTPLIFAFSREKYFKTHLILDERSSAFFALGLAKKLNQPTAVVTTSGTAAAELYPAIVEAYKSRIPLLIFTADRPARLRYSGANQTINQINIFANHIRKFYDLGLPGTSINKIRRLKNITREGFLIADNLDRGPVHFNCPFEKPFEPDAYTDKIDAADYKLLLNENIKVNQRNTNPIKNVKLWKAVKSSIKNSSKGIIFCGSDFYSDEFSKLCIQLSQKYNLPIIADGASNLRFKKHSQKRMVVNAANFLRTKEIRKKLDAGFIIQFGGAPTSKSLLDFFEETSADIFLVNKYGDIHDPSLSAAGLFKSDYESFCKKLLSEFKSSTVTNIDNNYSEQLLKIDKKVEEIKSAFLNSAAFPFEGKIINAAAQTLTSKFNLMVSNSMPIRDLDFFVSGSRAKINLYCSRGASGIDGITSTAMGIAKAAKVPTVLVTGDLAFFHDLNGLSISKLLSIPLTIVLINNNGGGIFEMLPIAEHKNVFTKFFKTPHNLSFQKFVQGFEGVHHQIKSWNDFESGLLKAVQSKNLTVLEIKTNSTHSLIERKRFWKSVSQTTSSFFDGN
ncbi:MAG: 2-succinyl-5-enolpyruvyl-6-hydroxy-3-cyclohexene-1-carboxylic-acid synthase [Ignavibacteriae bacterium]|nr:2-succinyl-5-enolpyruvyl-6-hydroxy-3-cyclohexene-1-carboxylic-acid synthase [Ignavibacteriota bacterium]